MKPLPSLLVLGLLACSPTPEIYDKGLVSSGGGGAGPGAGGSSSSDAGSGTITPSRVTQLVPERVMDVSWCWPEGGSPAAFSLSPSAGLLVCGGIDNRTMWFANLEGYSAQAGLISANDPLRRLIRLDSTQGSYNCSSGPHGPVMSDPLETTQSYFWNRFSRREVIGCAMRPTGRYLAEFEVGVRVFEGTGLGVGAGEIVVGNHIVNLYDSPRGCYVSPLPMKPLDRADQSKYSYSQCNEVVPGSTWPADAGQPFQAFSRGSVRAGVVCILTLFKRLPTGESEYWQSCVDFAQRRLLFARPGTDLVQHPGSLLPGSSKGEIWRAESVEQPMVRLSRLTPGGREVPVQPLPAKFTPELAGGPFVYGSVVNPRITRDFYVAGVDGGTRLLRENVNGQFLAANGTHIYWTERLAGPGDVSGMGQTLLLMRAPLLTE